jgi:UDP-glucose 4-epimerase
MNILVTGGAGFIGSHLCEKYTKEGHTVLCMDNFLSGDLINVRHLLDCRNFKLIKGDIRDRALLENVCRDVDVILNLAAQIHVDRSYIEPDLTYDINVMGTQNVLEVARFHDIEKVVHASTSEVYGSALHVPIDESHPLNAPHPYGASKIAADRMCYAYIHTYGLNVNVLRFFNIFGPRQRDVGYGGVISIFTRRIMMDMPPIIFGNGNQTRDYTYIDDAVRGYDMAMNYKDRIDEPVNFGTGKEITINEIAEMLIRLCGKEGQMEVVHVDPRIGEVKRLIANAKRAKSILGWKPNVDFEEGLEMFVKWYRNYGMDRRQTF